MSILSNAFERLIAAREAEARSYIELYSADFENSVSARDDNDK
ncbi:hypothetical protein SAMN04488056_11061 [Cohaesibacter marisflavi]|uniref:Uncharacterized protein n=1 Tax=Cohaesibacter marisflavi TaxID=655353 RepID=A0A1I5IY36_9HYPH|nr:hypothetical protein [Cohaesibacter marisflavi]SFO65402.1 hypothetical protein SAMN04488056_11061 [Cohaesibacter marisflavi]